MPEKQKLSKAETEAIDHSTNSLADRLKDSGELDDKNISNIKRVIVKAYWEGYTHGKAITKHLKEK